MSHLDDALRAAVCTICGHDCYMHTSSGCEDEDAPCDCLSDSFEALAPTVAALIIEAEQRGREDNADHGMCYVHGSRALDALMTEHAAKVAGEAVVVAEHCESVVASLSDHGGPWQDGWRSAHGVIATRLRAALHPEAAS